jgi:hypothetical protein
MGSKAKEKKSPAKATQPQAPAAPAIFEATFGPAGAVVRIQPPITQAQAEALRQIGQDVVVCGPNLGVNRTQAYWIEHNANGNCKRCPPHVNSAGPNALPHYQPDPRPPAGHTFYETTNRHAL